MKNERGTLNRHMHTHGGSGMNQEMFVAGKHRESVTSRGSERSDSLAEQVGDRSVGCRATVRYTYLLVTVRTLAMNLDAAPSKRLCHLRASVGEFDLDANELPGKVDRASQNGGSNLYHIHKQDLGLQKLALCSTELHISMVVEPAQPFLLRSTTSATIIKMLVYQSYSGVCRLNCLQCKAAQLNANPSRSPSLAHSIQYHVSDDKQNAERLSQSIT